MSRKSGPAPTLWWLRRDLRLEDNPALHWAVERGAPVLAVYIHAPEEEAPWSPGAASQWWLRQSLQALDRQLRAAGGGLLQLSGPSLPSLQKLIKATGAEAVVWNRLYEPAIVQRDTAVKAVLRAAGIETRSCAGHLLFEPWAIQTAAGGPYKVFTPYWRACQRHSPSSPQPPVQAEWYKPDWAELEAQPDPPPLAPWEHKLAEHWQPGAEAAQRVAQSFLDEGLGDYAKQRDYPAVAGSSRLSPYLHFGEISVRALWHACPADAHSGRESFLRELGWREFAHHLLWHFPQCTDEAFNPRFSGFPWKPAEAAAAELSAWQRGKTGIDIVDAGMQELWQSGWMHNRVRMLVGSLLTKNLGIHWQEGARWFWDTLVDADLANNSLGWQWIAGCGADASPYFRIFNPHTQAERFDAQGRYRQRWLGDSARPAPIVDLGQSRARALEAYKDIRAGAD